MATVWIDFTDFLMPLSFISFQPNKMSKDSTPSPTREPTPKPTQSPTRKPTSKPTRKPSPKPTSAPTSEPTVAPSASPTDCLCTCEPTAAPVQTDPPVSPSLPPIQTIQPFATIGPAIDVDVVDEKIVVDGGNKRKLGDEETPANKQCVNCLFACYDATPFEDCVQDCFNGHCNAAYKY